MSNFTSPIAAENMIMKAADVSYGYDASIHNVVAALNVVLSNSKGNFVIGGNVKPYSSGGLNVTVDPIYAFCHTDGKAVVETEITEPISFEEADSSLDRIDIVEVQGIEELFDQQSRMFNDPVSGTKTPQTIPVKKRIKLNIQVKKGSNGSETAPKTDVGFVKIAEVRIPAGTNNISGDLISNVSARKFDDTNKEWTQDKSGTFNPSWLANIFYTFLVEHNEDGSHKDKSIKKANIDFGTEGTQIKGADIPAGMSFDVHGEEFLSTENLTNLIKALVDNTNKLYAHSNSVMSRYAYISDVPVAASTTNVDIVKGGELSIDGVSVRVGNLVFLKNQSNPVENGFYEVQTGQWNRYRGYTSANAKVFEHKYVFVTTGSTNKGKIFYIADDIARIDIDPLNFLESCFTPWAKPNSNVCRDKNGRFKAAEPKEPDDVARKQEFDETNNNSDSTEGRDLLKVLGVSSVAAAMAILHEKTAKGDFTGLRIGDYLNLPQIKVGGTTYTYNASYQNTRIVISGFNQYIYCGDTENTKPHILWTFRNVVFQHRVNSSNTNAGGFHGSELGQLLNSDFAIGLGTALGSAEYLYEVRRAYSQKDSTAWFADKVFLPTEVEVFGTPTYGDDQKAWNTNIQYPIFRGSAYYRLKRYNGSRAWWWESTPYASNGAHFCSVYSDGYSHYSGHASHTGGGVAPAFCTC